MKTAWAIAYGVVVGLLAAGLVLLLGRSPAGTPIQLLPPPTPAPIQVHVTGAVNQAGLYSLPAGSRVEAAIQAAGGFAEGADERALNLAAFLEDGDRLLVPSLVSSTDTVPGETRLADPPLIFPIDINLATTVELEALPEIGPETARKILEYRQLHGPFEAIEDIMDVPGIGPVTFEAIKELITIGVGTVP
ncbi:MAG: helix-hairpin-helix domain-containing protein [Anaerolineales bacterium]|jgi:competence protein ComEA|nr:helix-hairpin-helix domain-containing protein [Anaerolineales bacterium]